MLDRVHLPHLTIEAPAPLPAVALVRGRTPDEAARLLPRIFNLCRHAQETAARMAFGLEQDAGAEAALSLEILRDHVMKLCLRWPGQFGGRAVPLPGGWAKDAQGLARALFGPAGRLPGTHEDLASFLRSDHGIAPLLARIAGCFGPGEAAADGLSLPRGEDFFRVAAVENSVAGRQADHPLMRAVERDTGRGPLWRALGRAVDTGFLLSGAAHSASRPARGRALVPAARGTYAVEAAVSRGLVSRFSRVTPTDHMLAAGGILARALATLPAARAELAPLLVEILDPCTPVRIREVSHA